MKRLNLHITVMQAVLMVVSMGCNDSELVTVPDPGEPPVAIIDAPASAFNTLDTTTLDGSASYDPEQGTAGIAGYRWSVTERPAGSSTAIAADGARADLWFDVAGHYQVSLVVTDGGGLESAPATVALDAIPPEDIHVEMSWNTDVTDVDLHLVNVTAGGMFYGEPYDCYYANATPEWGPSGNSGDPTLDIDDIDGFGPENINIEVPEPGHTYKVLVHYYDDANRGGSEPTVRIYLDGELRYDARQELGRTDQTWEVALIEWPSGLITPIDNVFDY